MKKTLSLVAASLLSMQAYGTPITFTGSSGSLAASVTFSTSGSNLLVTLTNTSTADVTVPADVLTGVFFTVDGDPTLLPVSALLSSGSVVLFGPNGSGNVGGEWAYVDGLSGAPDGADEGISSAGFTLFGAGNFEGANLQGPAAVNGLQYGLTSAGDNSATGNAAVTGGFALIQNSVDFVLSGLAGGFDPSLSISNVSFQYGSGLNEPNLPGDDSRTFNFEGDRELPVPASLALLCLGTLAMGVARRRRLGG